MSKESSQTEQREVWRMSMAEEHGFFPLSEPLSSHDAKENFPFYSGTLGIAYDKLKKLKVAEMAELVAKGEIHQTVLLRLLEELRRDKASTEIKAFDKGGFSEKLKQVLEDNNHQAS